MTCCKCLLQILELQLAEIAVFGLAANGFAANCLNLGVGRDRVAANAHYLVLYGPYSMSHTHLTESKKLSAIILNFRSMNTNFVGKYYFFLRLESDL